MPPATKEELDRSEARIKEHVAMCVRPLHERVSEHHETLYGCDEAPGLRVKVDRLEVQAERHTWALRAIGGTAISAIAGVVVSGIAWVKVHVK